MTLPACHIRGSDSDSDLDACFFFFFWFAQSLPVSYSGVLSRNCHYIIEVM